MYALFVAEMNGFLTEMGTELRKQYHVPAERKR